MAENGVSHDKLFRTVVFLKGGPPGVEVREVRHRVGPFEPLRWRYLAFGLSRSLAEDYVGRPQPLAAALAALMRSEVWDEVEKKLRCFDALSRARDLGSDRRFLLARVVETYVELDEEEQERFDAEMEREINKEVREMVVTWEEALAESRAEGRQEGQLEGRVVATQDAILRLVTRRNGSLPAGCEEKLRAIEDLGRLDEILDQVARGKPIEEIDLG